MFKWRFTETEDGGKLRSGKAVVAELLVPRVLSSVVEPQEDFFEDFGQTLFGAFKPFLFRNRLVHRISFATRALQTPLAQAGRRARLSGRRPPTQCLFYRPGRGRPLRSPSSPCYHGMSRRKTVRTGLVRASSLRRAVRSGRLLPEPDWRPVREIPAVAGLDSFAWDQIRAMRGPAPRLGYACFHWHDLPVHCATRAARKQETARSDLSAVSARRTPIRLVAGSPLRSASRRNARPVPAEHRGLFEDGLRGLLLLVRRLALTAEDWVHPHMRGDNGLLVT